MHLQAPQHGPRSRGCPRIRSAERLRLFGVAETSTGSGDLAGDEYLPDRLHLADLGSMPPSGEYQAALGVRGWRMDDGRARADFDRRGPEIRAGQMVRRRAGELL